MLENGNPEATIPTEGQDTIATEEAVNTVPEDGVEEKDESEATIPEDTSHEDEGEAIPEFALDVKYNKQNRTLSRDEAVTFAQKGMFYEEKGIEALYNKLDYLSSQKDISIEELVDGIISKDEADYRAELEAKFGAEDTETIEAMLQIRRNSQQEKYNKMLENRKNAETKQAEEKEQTLNNRLADEFIELKTEFPEIAEFKDLPNEVKSEAAKSGKDLLSCYLRYRYSEEKKIKAAQQTANSNSKSTTGSGGSAEPTEDSAASAVVKGIWSI